MSSLKEVSRARSDRTGLASARSRFERRAAAARRRPALLWGTLVGLLLLVGVVAWLGWFSAVLSADDVRVEGATGGAATQVRDVAQVPLGGALLRLDTDGVAARLVADRRWKDVSVARSLPHTVVVTVTPRVAALGIRRSATKIDLVDSDGLVFRTVAKAPAAVPVVQAGAAQVSPTGVQAALEATGALEEGLRAEVSGVTLSSADQVTFTLTHKDKKRTVIWGAAGEADLKARLVAVLLSEPGATIDVSVPSSPVTR